MENEPQIKLLPYKRRRSFFFVLLLIFIIALPTFIFYTSGYRLNFGDEETTIVTTGGIYITNDNLEVDVYLDDEQVEKPRLFRSAYYIQNIENGLHRVVVQKPGLHAWVKILPVDVPLQVTGLIPEAVTESCSKDVLSNRIPDVALLELEFLTEKAILFIAFVIVKTAATFFQDVATFAQLTAVSFTAIAPLT